MEPTVKRNLIIVAAAVVVVGLATGGFLFLRGRAGGGGAVVEPEIGAGGEQAGSPLKIGLGTSKEKEVRAEVIMSADSSGKPAIDIPKPLSAAEKESLGVSAEEQATITIKQADDGKTLVAEIVVGSPSTVAQAGGEAVPAGQGASVAIALPTSATGNLSLGMSKNLSEEEKTDLGLPDGSEASIILQPVLGGGVKAEIKVAPPPPDYSPSSGDQAAAAGDKPEGCGDYMCNAGETAATCSQDCTLVSADALRERLGYARRSDTSFTIDFLTNFPTKAVLDYGLTDKYEAGRVADEGEFKTYHEMNIGGLAPDKDYVARLRVVDKDGTERVLEGILFGGAM